MTIPGFIYCKYCNKPYLMKHALLTHEKEKCAKRPNEFNTNVVAESVVSTTTNTSVLNSKIQNKGKEKGKKRYVEIKEEVEEESEEESKEENEEIEEETEEKNEEIDGVDNATILNSQCKDIVPSATRWSKGHGLPDIFAGKELRVTTKDNQKWVSIFDVIRVAGGQKDSAIQKTWQRIKIKHENEIGTFCLSLNFANQRGQKIPCVNAKGLVKLLMWIPGKTAAKFREKAADIVVRYLGGDNEDIEQLEIMKKMDHLLKSTCNPKERSEKDVPSEFDSVEDKDIACKIDEEVVIDNGESSTSNSPDIVLGLPDIFAGKELRVTTKDDQKWVSVIDIIRVAGGQKNPHQTWTNILEVYKKEVFQFVENLKFKGSGQKNTPCINAKGLVKLLMWIPGKTAAKFRDVAADIVVRYLGGDNDNFEQLETMKKMDQLLKPKNKNIDDDDIEEEIIEDDNGSLSNAQSQDIISGLPDIFAGKELRVTTKDNQKWVSVFDVIKVAGGQTDSAIAKTWKRIKEQHEIEIMAFCHSHRFVNQRGGPKTPCINARGVVKLLFWIPGKLAHQFREKAADIVVRYLGGDTTLCEEVHAIDNAHNNGNLNDNAPAQFFRANVENNNNAVILPEENKWKPSSDNIAEHDLITLNFGDEAKFPQLIYAGTISENHVKIGRTDVGLMSRVSKHKIDFDHFNLFYCQPCTNPTSLERRIFADLLMKRHRVIKYKAKNGKNKKEIFIKSTDLTQAQIIRSIQKCFKEDEKLQQLMPISVPQCQVIFNNNNQDDINNKRWKHEERMKEIESQTQIKLKELDNDALKMNTDVRMMELQLEMRRLELSIPK